MKCLICKKEMNTGEIPDRDCGGDCLSCMADSGDPNCLDQMNKYHEELVKTNDANL